MSDTRAKLWWLPVGAPLLTTVGMDVPRLAPAEDRAPGWSAGIAVATRSARER